MEVSMFKNALLALPVALALGATANAQKAPEDVLQGLIDSIDSSYLTQSEMNLMMMPDSPALWLIDDGKELFHQARGPGNASLETCDFGKGPGVLEGAFVEFPRYFEDTGRVMDFESRLVHCMKTIQGFTDDEPAIKTKHGNAADITKLQTYVASLSNGHAWSPPMDHPMERAVRDAGEIIFYRRAGTMDFSCSTCHAATGKRIRASVLPNSNVPEEWTKAVSWPAFRVGHDNVRSAQHRVSECYWQMRHAEPVWGGTGMTAIISYWNDRARGQPAILPDMKR
jgi:L-cysteine S-thiosulfotransferase